MIILIEMLYSLLHLQRNLRMNVPFYVFPTTFALCLAPTYQIIWLKNRDMISFLRKHMADVIMTERAQIEMPKKKIEEFCRKHFIRKLSLFWFCTPQWFQPWKWLGYPRWVWSRPHTRPNRIGWHGNRVNWNPRPKSRHADSPRSKPLFQRGGL